MMTKRTIIWALLFAVLCSLAVGLVLGSGGALFWISRHGREAFPDELGASLLLVGSVVATIGTGFLTAGKARRRPLLHSMIGAWPFGLFWFVAAYHRAYSAPGVLLITELVFLIGSVTPAFFGGVLFVLRQRRRRRRAAAKLHAGTVDVF